MSLSENSLSESYDLVVIGGGAAGFFAAISAAELSAEPLRIVILEKGPEVLQKVKISGGGRCNVTHDLHDPREFTTNYPRGEKSLMGPLFRWNASDMIDWLEERGVELKTEADGRMFPTTDESQTIIDCFSAEVAKYGIEERCRTEVFGLEFEDGFLLHLKEGEKIGAKNVLIATGGIRNRTGADFAEAFGHSVAPAAPSLFTFKIADPRIEELAGISVPKGTARLPDLKLENSGPILITHWGLSGPGILKLSSKAARDLQEQNYQFEVQVSWAGPEVSQESALAEFSRLREESGAQAVMSRGRFEIPARLWKRLCEAAGIEPDLKWGNITKPQIAALLEQVLAGKFQANGKSMNKDEFVTCGGVSLKEVDFKTMESRLQPGLYFAGEVLDIDGVTGGFNFQSAWTTGRMVGEAIGGW